MKKIKKKKRKRLKLLARPIKTWIRTHVSSSPNLQWCMLRYFGFGGYVCVCKLETYRHLSSWLFYECTEFYRFVPQDISNSKCEWLFISWPKLTHNTFKSILLYIVCGCASCVLFVWKEFLKPFKGACTLYIIFRTCFFFAFWSCFDNAKHECRFHLFSSSFERCNAIFSYCSILHSFYLTQNSIVSL